MVKVGGMCWVIRTGARSNTGPSCGISALSACGPPVEAPISSTRGAAIANGRSAMAGAGDAPGTSGGDVVLISGFASATAARADTEGMDTAGAGTAGAGTAGGPPFPALPAIPTAELSRSIRGGNLCRT